jgi:hypothetical protein
LAEVERVVLMAGSSHTYKQYIPDIGLSIEKNTENVPHDGNYYLVRNGQIVKGFRTLKKAEVTFKEAVAESGYMPKPVEKRKKSAAEQDTDRYLDAKDHYWAESYKYRGKGGKGGRGGV